MNWDLGGGGLELQRCLNQGSHGWIFDNSDESLDFNCTKEYMFNNTGLMT